MSITVAGWQRRGDPVPWARWAASSPHRWALVRVAPRTVAYGAIALLGLLQSVRTTVVVVVVAFGLIVVVLWYRQALARARHLQDALALWEQEDRPPPSHEPQSPSPYDPEQITLSGWKLKGSPGRVARWSGQRPVHFQTVMTLVCVVPVAGLAVAGIVLVDESFAKVILAFAATWFGVSTWGNWYRMARRNATALDLWNDPDQARSS